MSYDLTFDKELVLHFLLVFSRFEYALKRAGFLRKGRTIAEADWDEFLKYVEPTLKSGANPDFEQARTYMRTYPPSKQINLNETLAWEQIDPGEEAADDAYLVQAVRVVRNNLFHGGKYPTPTGPMQDVARDHQLLNASLTILKRYLPCASQVKEFYEETA